MAVDQQGRVFTGGFASVGYWEKDLWGNWQYTSIKDKIADFGKEEIWHFLPNDKGLLFQSFARMYFFDGEEVKQVHLPGNIMFAQQVNGRILIPVIQSGLYEYFPDGRVEFVPGSELFHNFRIATILPGPGDTWLVGTQKNGIYQYQNGQFEPWQAAVNPQLSQLQLNKGIRCSNGNYAFGTIVDGVLITDSLGTVQHHINWEVGLQNNTILALMEDKDQQLWVGMDAGIDLIETNSPLRYFQGNRSGIGAVYAAALSEEKLYIGTNQGVFWKPWPSERGMNFKLLEHSQGQVWDLQTFDGELVGAHNNGAFVIKNNQMTFLSGHTGSYSTIAPPNRNDILLQGTYIGIIVLKKSAQGQWEYAHQLENFPVATRRMIFDSSGNLWVAHPHWGVSRLTLDSDYTSVKNRESFGEKEGLSFDYKSSLLLKNGKIVLKSDQNTWVFDESMEQLRAAIPDDNLPFSDGNYKILTNDDNSWFEVFPDSTIGYFQGWSQQFNISLFPKHEQIISLTDSIYLFCLDSGYALYHVGNGSNANAKIDATPQIVRIEVNNKRKLAGTIKEPPQLPGRQLRFIYAIPHFTQQLPMSYRLIGFNQDWSAYSHQYSREYTNLPVGKYEFQVKTRSVSKVASFEFVVLPKWYESWWANLLFLLLLIGLGYLLLRWHRLRLERQERKLWIEKERELQRQRMQASNKQLRMEIDNKSRQLADSTMNLVRKNEILTKLKKELVHYKLHEGSKNPNLLINNQIKLIDVHLSSDEDWIHFEEIFNQLHDNFFKRLKQLYPELTAGDLRLAAYLKMNLSSKEIAPLLNISIRGIENKRYRLRRKMNLKQEENLTEFLIHF